ncbi:hypothetical protein JXL21_00150 [Candidatus Bathyarchaeota archaeon]|nr:hypothetical protein [Candidatus Bathyarchaeota archaeon]
MAANPVVALGIVCGLAAGAFIYFRERNTKKAALWAVTAFLALGTPLHFIIVPILAGYRVNALIHRYLQRNWTAFLVSLLGAPVLLGVLQVTGRLYVVLSVPAPIDLGKALAVGITMGIFYAALIVIGVASYAISSLVASFRRRNQTIKTSDAA